MLTIDAGGLNQSLIVQLAVVHDTVYRLDELLLCEAGHPLGLDLHQLWRVVTRQQSDDTRLVGSSDDYGKVKEKNYDQNGLFIFNPEKRNNLTASYGVDIEVIDKAAPTIDLLGTSEMVFYENPEMNTDYDRSMLEYVNGGKYKAYEAYDIFGGVKTDLTESVKVVD